MYSTVSESADCRVRHTYIVEFEFCQLFKSIKNEGNASTSSCSCCDNEMM